MRPRRALKTTFGKLCVVLCVRAHSFFGWRLLLTNNGFQIWQTDFFPIAGAHPSATERLHIQILRHRRIAWSQMHRVSFRFSILLSFPLEPQKTFEINPIFRRRKRQNGCARGPHTLRRKCAVVVRRERATREKVLLGCTRRCGQERPSLNNSNARRMSDDVPFEIQINIKWT